MKIVYTVIVIERENEKEELSDILEEPSITITKSVYTFTSSVSICPYYDGEVCTTLEVTPEEC